MEQKSWLINKKNGVYFLTPPSSDFEDAYTAIRNKEKRLLTDENVLLLPHSKINQNEWKKRIWTLNQFEEYLTKKRFESILDIGCGNGWFTSRLSKHAETVIGLDVGVTELEQAARCFCHEKCTFICCSNWKEIPEKTFDCITFNGSAHYFDTNAEFWESLYRLLKPGGEIHLLDSPIYEAKEREFAKERSSKYFKEMGVPKAANFYKQIVWKDLPTNKKIRYRPNRFLNKLFNHRSPFPWICIYKP